MNSISLKKVTLLVGTCALASYFVSAEDNVASLEVPAVEQVVTKPAVNKMLLANKWVKIDKSIPTLLTQLDHDKNGSLNEAEVIASKDDQLVKHFKDIDKNADAEISEVELKSYLAALK